MLCPIKIIDIELTLPLPYLDGLENYMEIQALVRLHGTPIGYIKAPITNGKCSPQTLKEIIIKEHSWKIINCLIQHGLTTQPNLLKDLNFEQLFNVLPTDNEINWPLVTVVVCTRDRASDLALCLEAINHLDYPNLDVLIVDNAPTSEATKELVQTKYSNFRYVCEPRPGLDWARNRGIIEAKGEIIAYTDDDVIVDQKWVKALAKVFLENSEVMAVTGLVVPYELETEAQILFEMYGGFGRGFERKWRNIYPRSKIYWLGTGDLGTGANMAYRRSVFEQIGLFDPALDVGTVTNGGGDLEMFFRVLQERHTLVYEPSVIVRHRHRRDYAKLKTQLENNSIGFFSHCVRSIIHYPSEWKGFLRVTLWWIIAWNLTRLWVSFKHPNLFPRDLIIAEFKACWPGLFRYQKARKKAEEIAKSFEEQQPTLKQEKELTKITPQVSQKSSVPLEKKMAVRTVELSQPLKAITDLTDYSDVRVFVSWQQQIVGSVDIANIYQSVSVNRLSYEIARKLGLQVLAPCLNLSSEALWARALSAIEKRLTPDENQTLKQLPSLPKHIPVSVVVATYDRPEDLKNCLKYLVAQNTSRPVEIIVVDNHPSSGLTPPIVAQFPTVKLVVEPRQGLAYARNAGFVASSGEIVVATDDDVTVPPDWLERLVAPFARPDVMITTGNVLPLQLETFYQYLFEVYGGLGRGFVPYEVGFDWFKSYRRDAVWTWSLGATANAAFRASIFEHPQIGIMEEALGPGMPSGVGEDTYLFYKVLKAGYTIVYEPAAMVWHKHRRDLAALRRQIYNYSKGHVSYNLTTWLQDNDWRGLWRIMTILPLFHLKRILMKLIGRSDYPISFILLEIKGNLAGPWSLWRSHQRVKQEGHSDPYIPVSQRSQTSPLIEKVPV